MEGPRTRHWRSRRTLFADGHGAVMARRLKLAPRPAIYRNMEHSCISPYAHRAGSYYRAIIRDYTRPSMLDNVHCAESIR